MLHLTYSKSRSRLAPGIVIILLAVAPALLFAADQPQWGQRWTRNMVSDEKDLPDTFDLKTGQNIKWVAPIGTQTHGTPLVAGGRIYIGTNNENPRNAKATWDSGVLMCFDEATGNFLWQLVVPKREGDIYYDWPKTGWSSPVTVEGDRIYTVSNRGEALCLDPRGMANGNDGPYRDEATHMMPRGTNAPLKTVSTDSTDGDIIWLTDLAKDAGIWTHDGAHSSILIHGDYLYLNSGTGVDNTHAVIRTPDAPSLIVLEKKTGRLVARDDEHIAPNIFHCTWSSPSLAEINGRPLIFFAGGNGVVYAFEPISKSPPAGQLLSLKKVWQFDFDPTAPKENIHSYLRNRAESPSDIYGMPVVYKNRIYVAGGGDIWWGKNQAWLKCINATKTGDITSTGEIWSYPLEKHVMSTVAIYNGLVFIADCGRKFHCVDAETGKPYWTHDIKGEVWASPLVADGKVYLGTRSGDYYIFAATREKNVLSSFSLGNPISATATAANGVVYVATMKDLIAIQQGAHLKPQQTALAH